jgi:hypothetical protein
LNTALAVGFFNIKQENYSVVLAAFGPVVSDLWFMVTLGQ